MINKACPACCNPRWSNNLHAAPGRPIPGRKVNAMETNISFKRCYIGRDKRYSGKSAAEEKAFENPLLCLDSHTPSADISEYYLLQTDEKGGKVCVPLTIQQLAQAAIDYIAQNPEKANQLKTAGMFPAFSNYADNSIAYSARNVSAAENTGNGSLASNKGYGSSAANTGAGSIAANTGDRSAAVCTGRESAASNSGDLSVAVTTGDFSTAEVSGQQSVALAVGRDNRARGEKGSWIVCAEWDDVDEKIINLQCAFVDGEKIKANTWYALCNGKFVEII